MGAAQRLGLQPQGTLRQARDLQGDLGWGGCPPSEREAASPHPHPHNSNCGSQSCVAQTLKGVGGQHALLLCQAMNTVLPLHPPVAQNNSVSRWPRSTWYYWN